MIHNDLFCDVSHGPGRDRISIVLKATGIGKMGLDPPLCRPVIHPLDKSPLVSAADMLSQNNDRTVAGFRDDKTNKVIHPIFFPRPQPLHPRKVRVIGDPDSISAGGDIAVQGQVSGGDLLKNQIQAHELGHAGGGAGGVGVLLIVDLAGLAVHHNGPGAPHRGLGASGSRGGPRQQQRCAQDQRQQCPQGAGRG